MSTKSVEAAGLPSSRMQRPQACILFHRRAVCYCALCCAVLCCARVCTGDVFFFVYVCVCSMCRACVVIARARYVHALHMHARVSMHAADAAYISCERVYNVVCAAL